jgi:anti-sigma factor RsiW
MHDTICPLADEREELLVAYFYDELDHEARSRFTDHLSLCARCRSEVAGFGRVRQRLTTWSPPEPGRGWDAAPVRQPVSTRWWSPVPAWAQVAAAVLLVAVSAGIANLDVTISPDGLSVRTGWMRSDLPAAGPSVVSLPVPWRSDLQALEERLRADVAALRASRTRVATTDVGAQAMDPGLERRVKTMVDESERRQQRELALRVADVMRDVQAQRQADLVRIDRSIGSIQSDTGVEVMRQRELLNYLVRASQRQ